MCVRDVRVRVRVLHVREEHFLPSSEFPCHTSSTLSAENRPRPRLVSGKGQSRSRPEAEPGEGSWARAALRSHPHRNASAGTLEARAELRGSHQREDGREGRLASSPLSGPSPVHLRPRQTLSSTPLMVPSPPSSKQRPLQVSNEAVRTAAVCAPSRVGLAPEHSCARASSGIDFPLIAVCSLLIVNKLASSVLSCFGRKFEIAGDGSAAWYKIH